MLEMSEWPKTSKSISLVVQELSIPDSDYDRYVPRDCTHSSLVAYRLNALLVSASYFSIFDHLHSTRNYNMAFNSYAAIEARISEACDAIHDGWYSNCTQAATAYEVPIRRLRRRVEWKRVKKYTSIYQQSSYRRAGRCNSRVYRQARQDQNV